MRQDTKMPAEAKDFAAGAASPAQARRRRGLDPRRSRTPTASCARSSGSTSRSPAHGVLGLVGPSGCGKSTLLELICRPAASPSAGDDRGRRRARRRRAARAAAPSCPSATCCCPGSRRSTTPRWRCATAASRRGEARRRGGPALRALRPRRLRARPAGRALGRDAPAGRLPAHAARRQAGAGARRALRLARRDHPRRDAGLAGRRAAQPTRAPSSSSPTTSRRRSTSPTASPCSRRGRRGWSRS